MTRERPRDRTGDRPDDGASEAAGADDGGERLRELAVDYHVPPPTPREAMWEEIRSRIEREAPAGGTVEARVVPIRPPASAGRPGQARPSARRVHWLGIGGAAAAMVALGFALGRMTGPAEGPAGPAVAAGATLERSVLRTAAADHLAQSEELLTAVRADALSGRLNPGVGTWGRGLLLETRMLLDSPASSDPELKTLLEDLELILAQISLLGEDDVAGARGPEELQLIAQGIETQDVLPRIQAALPAQAGS